MRKVVSQSPSILFCATVAGLANAIGNGLSWRGGLVSILTAASASLIYVVLVGKDPAIFAIVAGLGVGRNADAAGLPEAWAIVSRTCLAATLAALLVAAGLFLYRKALKRRNAKARRPGS